ncbi:MAG: metal-dependent hydrolase [bacterium]|nr:metal-dependent hydrolase [bacterium]
MTGRTHWAVGTASALGVLQPQGVREWAICAGAAAVGAVICDVDVSTSDSRAVLNRITVLTVLAVLALGFVEFRWKLGIMDTVSQRSGIPQLLIGAALLLVVCTFGKYQPHRSFMHSIPAWVGLSGIVYFMYPPLMPPFAIAMLSHITIDLLNRKKVRLLYPAKWGLCLGLCTAGGRVNRIMGYAATGLAIVFSAKALLPL